LTTKPEKKFFNPDYLSNYTIKMIFLQIFA